MPKVKKVESDDPDVLALKEIIATTLIVDETEVTQGALLYEDLGADSVDMVEIVMEIEDRYGVEIDDEEAEKLLTFEDLLKVIQSAKEEKEKGQVQ